MKQKQFYETRVVVRGRGRFPTDMLRYHKCFPASEVDAYRMLEDGERGITLTVMSHDGAKTNRNRWLSFGWDVIYDNGEDA